MQIASEVRETTQASDPTRTGNPSAPWHSGLRRPLRTGLPMAGTACDELLFGEHGFGLDGEPETSGGHPMPAATLRLALLQP